jgi:hypothetical protein
MQSLNEIAENIALKISQQFNQTALNSIKATILNYRSKYIRDDLDRNPLSEIHFTQTITLQFEEVNLLQEFGGKYDCITSICPDVLEQSEYSILKSTKDIPTPIRLKSSGRNPFFYFGTVTGFKNFTFTTLDKFAYYKTLPYQSKTIYYTIINNRAYILNNLDTCDINDTLSLCNVLVKSVFENPSEAYDACVYGHIRKDDMPFPISRDMLMSLSNAIQRNEYLIAIKDGQEVNIKPDPNDND